MAVSEVGSDGSNKGAVKRLYDCKYEISHSTRWFKYDRD